MEICYSRDALADYLERTAEGGRPRGDDLPRPLPRERHRGGRGRALRRRVGADRGDHAARGGGRRPLGRLRLRDPRDVAGPGDDPPGPGRHRAAGAAARGGGPDQHPVRRARRRRAVRDRGQPARIAHRAFRLQGGGRAAGQGGLPADAGRAAGRPRPGHPGRARARVREGGGAAVRPLPARGLAAGPRDEVHRRGDGRGVGLPGGVRQGAGGGRGGAARPRARSSSASPTATSPPPPSSPPRCTTGFSVLATGGTAAGHPADGGAGGAHPQALRRARPTWWSGSRPAGWTSW